MSAARPIVFVDTETTCLGPEAHPWEIAVIRRTTRPGSVAHPGPRIETDTWVLQVEYEFATLPPGTSPQALSVGRWLERGAPGSIYLERINQRGINVQSGKEGDIALRLAEQLADEPILVGVGVQFDAAVLTALFARHGLPTEPWHYGTVDLKAATWGYMRGRERDVEFDDTTQFKSSLPMSSERLAACLDVQPPADDERHTALGDARWAARWFDALTGAGR